MEQILTAKQCLTDTLGCGSTRELVVTMTAWTGPVHYQVRQEPGMGGEGLMKTHP